MFEFLFKYIDKFNELISYGEWVSDGIQHEGTLEDPIPFPSISYDECVDRFIEEVTDFAISHKLTNYDSVINKNIDDNSDSIDVFYKILGIVRSERFCDGVVLRNLVDGTIVKLINILKKRYDASINK